MSSPDPSTVASMRCRGAQPADGHRLGRGRAAGPGPTGPATVRLERWQQRSDQRRRGVSAAQRSADFQSGPARARHQRRKAWSAAEAGRPCGSRLPGPIQRRPRAASALGRDGRASRAVPGSSRFWIGTHRAERGSRTRRAGCSGLPGRRLVLRDHRAFDRQRRQLRERRSKLAVKRTEVLLSAAHR